MNLGESIFVSIMVVIAIATIFYSIKNKNFLKNLYKEMF